MGQSDARVFRLQRSEGFDVRSPVHDDKGAAVSDQPHYATSVSILRSEEDTGIFVANDHHEQGLLVQTIMTVLNERYPLSRLSDAINRCEGLLTFKSLQPAERRAVKAILKDLQVWGEAAGLGLRPK